MHEDRKKGDFNTERENEWEEKQKWGENERKMEFGEKDFQLLL